MRRATETFTITVNPSAQVDDPTDLVLCHNDTQSEIVFSTQNTGGTTSYSWSIDESIGLSPTSGTGNIPSFTALNDNPPYEPLIATITVTPTFTNAGVTCTGVPEEFTITVNPSAQVDDPTDLVLCHNDTQSEIVFSTQNTGGTTSYSWSIDESIGLSPTSGTGNIPSFTALNDNPPYEPLIATITVTPTFTNAGVTCTGVPEEFTITVNPSAQVDDPTDLVLCHNDTQSEIVFSTQNTGGTTSYSWSIDESIGLSPTSGTGNIPSFTALNDNPPYEPLIATITVTPTFTNAGVTCTGVPEEFTITVNPSAQVDDPTDLVLCHNDTQSEIVFSTQNTGGTTSYSWSIDESIGLSPTSGTGNIPSFTALNDNPPYEPLIATITVTPTFTNAGVTCTGVPEEFTITVNPIPTLTAIAAETICGGTAFTTVNFVSNVTGADFNWVLMNPPVTSPEVDDITDYPIDGSGTSLVGQIVNNGGDDPYTLEYQVTPVYEGCTGTPQNFLLTVNPAPTVSFSIPDQEVCTGEDSSEVTLTSPTAGATITWNVTSLPVAISGVTQTSGTTTIPVFTLDLDPSVDTAQVIEITAQATTSDAESCLGSLQVYTITVNPRGQIDPIADVVYCSGDVTDEVVFTNAQSTGETIYDWSIDQSIGLSPTTGQGNLPSFTAAAGTEPIVATVSVVSSFSNSTGSSVNCAGATETFTITVNPSAQVDDPTDLVLCHNDTQSEIVFSTQNTGGTTSYSWSIDESIGLSPTSGTGNIPSFTALNDNPPYEPLIATITVTPTFTNAGVTCTGVPEEFTITVNPSAQVDDPTDLVLCHNDTQSEIVFSTQNTGGTTSYSWSIDESIGLSPTSGTGNIPSFTALNDNPPYEPLIATITVTPTFTNAGVTCTGVPEEFTITVNPSAQVDDPTDLVLCHNDTQSEIVFSTQNTGGTTSYSWSIDESIGLSPTSGTGNIPSFTALNDNPPYEPLIATITVTPTFTNAGVTCTGVPEEFTITVNPSAQVDDPTDLVLCHNDTQSEIVFSTQNTGGTTSYSWSIDESIGLSPTSGTGNIPSFTALNDNPPYEPLIATITVTPTFTNAGVTCTGVPEEFTITVNPIPTLTAIAAETICGGTAFTTVNFVSNVTGADFNWVLMNPPVTSPEVDDITDYPIDGSGTSLVGQIVNNGGDDPYTLEYQVTPVYEGCTGTPQNFLLTVNPAPTVSFSIPDQEICDGGTTLAVPFNSSTTNITYQWEIGTPDIETSGIDGFTATTGTQDTLPAFTLTNSNPFTVDIEIDVIAIVADGSACPGPSSTYIISVQPDVEITTDPIVSQDLCVGGDSSELTVTHTTGVGTPSYQWFESTDNGVTYIAVGPDSISYTPPTYTTVGTYFYYVSVDYDGSGCDAVSSALAQVNVLADPLLTLNISTQQLCLGSTPTDLIVTATGGADPSSYTYEWYDASDTSTPVGTGSTYTPPTVPVGTTDYYVVVTTTASGCSTTSGNTTVDVIPAPEFTQQPQPTQTVCLDGSTTDLTVSVQNFVGTATYQWFENSVPSNTGGTLLTETSSTFTPPSTPTGTKYYYCEVSFSEGGCTLITSNLAQVDVVPDVEITTDPIVSQDLCVGGDSSELTVTHTTGVGTPSYQWFESTDNGVTYIAVGPDSISYTPPTYTTVGTYFYYVSVDYDGSGCDAVSSALAQVNVLADPLLTLNISTQQLCLGSTPTDLIVTATGGADPSSYTYEWYDASDTSTPVGTGSTYTPPTVPVGTTDYYVVVTTTASGCSTTSGNTTVDVIPAPEFTQQPQPTQTVCLDGSTTDLTVSVQNFVGTATYQWFENSVPSNTGGTLLTETSSTFTPPSTPTGTKYYYCEVSFSEGGCTLITSNLAQVDVGQVPNIQDEQFIICSEEPINFDPSSIAGNTVPIGTTYSWTVVDSPNITNETAENDQASFVQALTNETNQIQILTYTVVPTSGDIGNCVGDPFIIVVTVNPKPAIADKLDQICSNTSFTLDLASGDADPTDIIPNNTTYTWTVNDNPNITGESNSVGSSSLVTQTLINESNSTQIVTYVITPTTSLGCVGDTFNLTVSVDPKPTITDKVAVICSGESFLVQPTNSPPGNIVPAGTTYTWTVAANNDVQGELAQTVPQSSISQALTNDSFVDQILFYEVTPSTNGCDGNPFTVTVTVKPEPTISILTNDTQLGCSGDTFGAVTFDSTVANTTYQWELQNTTVPLLVSGYPTNGNGDFPSLVLENGLTMAFTLIYEVTPTAAGCEGPPLVFEITINPVPVLLFSDNDQILCNMDASAPVTISSTTPDVNIQWTIPNPPNAADLIGVSQLSGAASIPSMVLENKTQAPIDLVFEASATTNDASACPGSNFYYTITVLPSAEINPISDEIVCSTYNTPVININTPTSPSGSITYTWDVTFAGLNLSGYLTSGLGTQIPSQVVQNATNVVERLEYTITPYINGCPGIVEVVNLFIDPTPEIQDMTATICSEDTFDVLPVNDSPIGPNIVPAGTTYTWTVAANNDVEGELAQTVPQSSISQDLINTSHVDQIVTYTVEPTTVDGCIGQTFQVDITVEPRPIVTDKFESICSGDAFDVVPVNTPPGQIVPANTLYTWTVSTNPFISGSSDQTTPVGGISQILTSISDVTETIVYTVTPISGSCIGLDFDITVSVSPRPFIEDVVLTPICSEDTFVYVPVTGVPNASIIVPAGTTYTWTVIDNLDVEGDINESTPQVSISQTLENTSSVVQTVIYEVTPISSGCQGPPFALSIDVKPRPHVINMPQMTNTQCSGEPFIILPQDGIPDAGTIIPAGTTYTWVVSSPNFDLNGWSNNSTPSATISQTLVNTTNIEQQIGYTVTPEADGCIGEPFDVLIWVEPKPYIPNVIQTLCDSESYVLSPVNGINPDGTTIIPNVTTYTWSDPLVVGSTDLNDVTGWTTAVDAPFFDSGILENNTTDQQTVIFTITPTYFVTSNPLIAQCVGDDFTITITLNPSPEMNEVITDVACSYSNPICGASIELSPIGGNPFTYEWIYLTDPSILLPNSTDEDQYDLCPGDYQVTVLDDFGCSYVFQYTIEPPTPIDFQIETLVNISCNNVNVPPCDGYIDLGISGGTAPYVSMEWFTESMSGSCIRCYRSDQH